MAALTIQSCSCSDHAGTKSHKPSPEAIEAGHQAADELLAVVTDENAVTELLLDIRSRIYDISCQYGEEAAGDFEQAFEERIRTGNDSIARILF
ncbi:MAG: hypothetical protein NC098_04550 [Lachnoclostridium sp.]|nr:hypothetical protein [Lachnoclostridium sp.]